MNNKVYQKTIDYNLKKGILSLNIYNGSYIYSYPLINIGKNNYTLSTRLVYNSSYDIASFNYRKIGFGNGFKLDIEEHLFSYQNNYNLPNFETGDYVYIDGLWNIHRFIYYKNEIINNLTYSVYYDDSGTGLILRVSSNKIYIEDENKNSLIFQNGRLIEIRSSIYSSIIKKIIYQNNDLVSFYDNRKQTRLIDFSYSNHLLTSVTNTLTNESVSFEYLNSKLSRIIRSNSNYLKVENIIKYSNDKIAYIIDLVSLDTIKLEHNNLNQLSIITTGVMKEDVKAENASEVYCGENVFLGDDIYLTNEYLRKKRKVLSLPSNCIKQIDSYMYNQAYTEVLNKEGIAIRYYFDILGRNISILEYKSTNDTYFTLENEIGSPLSINEGNNLFLNGIGAVLLNHNNQSYIIDNNNPLFATFLTTIANGTYNEEHVLSFYLYTTTIIQERVIEVSYTINNLTESKKVLFSDTLSNTWQRIEIPINLSILMYLLTDITISFNLAQNEIAYISDIRMTKGSIADLLIDNISPIEHNENGNTVREIKLGSKLYLDQVQYIISQDFYLTENDITSTYKSISDCENGSFDFYYNNKTKVKNVSSVYLENIYYEFIVTNGTPNYHYYSVDFVEEQKFLIKEIQPHFLNVSGESMKYVSLETKVCEMISPNRNIRIAIHDSNILNDTIYVSKTEILTNGLKYSQYNSLIVNGFEERTITRYYYLDGNLYLEQVIYDDNNTIDTIEKNYYYSNDGELLISAEEDNIETFYEYYNDLNVKSITKDNLKKVYNYDSYYNLTSIDFIDINLNTVVSSNIINYNKKDLISSLKTNDNSYGFLYNGINDLYSLYVNKKATQDSKKTKINNNEVVTTNIYNNDLTSFQETYDKYDRLIQKKINNKVINYSYENNGMSEYLKRVIYLNDPYTNKDINISYDDSLGKIVKNVSNDITIISTDNSKEYQILSDANYKCESIDYGLLKRVVNSFGNSVPYTLINELSYIYKFDYFNRLIIVHNSFNDGYVPIDIYKEIKYQNKTIKPIELIYNVVSTINNHEYNASFSYSNIYNGSNIIEVNESGKVFNGIPNSLVNVSTITLPSRTYTFSYDAFNRLIQETSTNEIINYQYGLQSNMIEKVYKDNLLVKEFSYSEGRLTSYNKNGIVSNVMYDSYGNITSVCNTNYTYDERNFLSSVTSNSITINFNYNIEGIRVSKETNNKFVRYYNDGSKIIGEDWYTNEVITKKFRYFYNEEGICGIKYNNKFYQLIRNSLGDISKIMYHGYLIGEYIYDAWGNCVVENNSIELDDIFVLENNPFRYKGYYLDIETNLYYLISRYYSPELYIFISPDNIRYLDVYSINGLNQYCYCLNNLIKLYSGSGSKKNLYHDNLLLSRENNFASSSMFLNSHRSNNNVFGFMRRKSIEFSYTPIISTYEFGRIGLFSSKSFLYENHGIINFVYGNSINGLNIHDIASNYIGFEINLFDFLSYEMTYVFHGVRTSISLFDFFVELDINFLDESYFMFGFTKNEINENTINACMIGLNTGALVYVLVLVAYFLATGDISVFDKIHKTFEEGFNVVF